MQAALDMQSGVVLDDPMAEFYALGQHPEQGDKPAVGVAGLTLSVKQGGGKAAYAPGCTDTDAVGMACEQVTGELFVCKPVVTETGTFVLLHWHEKAKSVGDAVLAVTTALAYWCSSSVKITDWSSLQ